MFTLMPSFLDTRLILSFPDSSHQSQIQAINLNLLNFSFTMTSTFLLLFLALLFSFPRPTKGWKAVSPAQQGDVKLPLLSQTQHEEINHSDDHEDEYYATGFFNQADPAL
jgi:hypothetical protein